MTINYGKRNGGGLSAASPGDTLYIPFATYNDSGASIGIAGSFAASDIEVFKNGVAVARATDSGYSVISDTGQYGNLLGLHRFSLTIFNTADDTGFYDAGGQYHVAIDSITVDGRTVRFIPAVFEIGTVDVNVTRIDGDTGAADRWGKLAGLQLKTDGTFDTGTGQVTNTFNVTATATTDTGQVNNAVWNGLRADHVAAGSFGQYVTSDVQYMDGDTGAADVLQKFADTVGALSPTGELDTGSGTLSVIAIAPTDTGAVSNAVWNSLRSAHVGAGSFGESDTGINLRLAVILADTDTGIQSGVNVTSIADTGISSRFSQVGVTSFSDTGVNNRLAVILSDTDTGIQSSVSVTSISDTGINSRFSQVGVTSFSDTGVNNRLSVILSDTDTGIQSGVNVTSLTDTGIYSKFLQVGVTSFSDTGVNNRLDVILADTDTGIQSGVTVTALSDTGVTSRLTTIQTKTDSLTFTTAGQVDANIQSVNDTALGGTGATGDEWGPA